MKEFLSQKGIAYEEKDVSIDKEAAYEMVQKTGQMGVPVTILEGEVIIGFDQERLENLIAAASTGRPSFGLRIADARTISMKQGGVPVFGAYVGDAHEGSIAARMGLKAGDVITELNMQPIDNSRDLEIALSKLTVGAMIQIVFMRGNQSRKAEGIFK